jgi:hypothetical protein
MVEKRVRVEKTSLKFKLQNPSGNGNDHFCQRSMVNLMKEICSKARPKFRKAFVQVEAAMIKEGWLDKEDLAFERIT